MERKFEVRVAARKIMTQSVPVVAASEEEAERLAIDQCLELEPDDWEEGEIDIPYVVSITEQPTVVPAAFIADLERQLREQGF